MFEADQMNHLLIDTEVQALIGNRIYPGKLPTDPVLPAVTYSLISSPRDMTQQGAGLANPRFRWNAFALTYDESIEVAYAIARALLPFGAWVDSESDHQETNTAMFRRRVETKSWIPAPEAN